MNHPVCIHKKAINLPHAAEYLYCEICCVAWRRKNAGTIYDQSYYQSTSLLAGKISQFFMGIFYKMRINYTSGQRDGLWIDVGAGDGCYLQSVPGTRKLGVEISPIGRKLIEKKGLENITPEEFLYSNQLQAQVISFWHVLEHVSDPTAYLKTAHRNLDHGGKIVVAVPNIKSWEWRIFGRRWFHFAPQFHLWHFSPDYLYYLLESVGFKVEKIDYFSPEHHFAGLLQSVINLTASSPDVLHKIFRRVGIKTVLTLRDTMSCVFWITLGLPVVLIFFLIASLARRSGSVVIVASLKH